MSDSITIDRALLGIARAPPALLHCRLSILGVLTGWAEQALHAASPIKIGSLDSLGEDKGSTIIDRTNALTTCCHALTSYEWYAMRLHVVTLGLSGLSIQGKIAMGKQSQYDAFTFAQPTIHT